MREHASLAVNMAGKRTTNMGGANNAVPVMSNTRRRSSARKNKAFMMLQRDMEQVTTGGRNGRPQSFGIFAFLRIFTQPP